MSTGKLIVFEGLDGCGKTTQLKLLADYLVRMEVPYVVAKQPSRGAVGKLLRTILNGDEDDPGARVCAMLFAADRVDQAAREIAPALARGDVVLCDRYYHSSMAYQALGPDGHDSLVAQEIRAMNRHAPTPRMTLIFEVPVAVAAARVAARGGATEIYDTPATQASVARAYRAMDRWLYGEAIVYINGSQSPGMVHVEALDALAGIV